MKFAVAILLVASASAQATGSTALISLDAAPETTYPDACTTAGDALCTGADSCCATFKVVATESGTAAADTAASVTQCITSAARQDSGEATTFLDTGSYTDTDDRIAA